jgi:YD repeat-containing protein
MPTHIKTYFKSGSTDTYDIVYNSNGKPVTETLTNDAGVQDYQMSYQYNSLDQLTRKTFTDLRSNTSSYDSYTYSSGNLSRVERYDYQGNLVDSYTYSYGATDNKLALNSVQLNEVLHLDDDMESLIYDALLSDSKLMNAITYTAVGKSAVVYNITYDLNANGYPEAVKSNGRTIITNQFNCK